MNLKSPECFQLDTSWGGCCHFGFKPADCPDCEHQPRIVEQDSGVGRIDLSSPGSGRMEGGIPRAPERNPWTS